MYCSHRLSTHLAFVDTTLIGPMGKEEGDRKIARLKAVRCWKDGEGEWEGTDACIWTTVSRSKHPDTFAASFWLPVDA